MVAGDTATPTSRNSLFMKGLAVIADFASGPQYPTPLFGTVLHLSYSACSAGLQDVDTAAVCQSRADGKRKAQPLLTRTGLVSTSCNQKTQ